MRSYCQTFMADGVPFFIDFHLAKGDEQVQLSPWRNHHNMGRVRELQFVTQLKVLPTSATTTDRVHRLYSSISSEHAKACSRAAECAGPDRTRRHQTSLCHVTSDERLSHGLPRLP